VGSRPPARLRSLWLRLGSSNVVFIGIAPTQGYGPQDLDVGETAIYNAAKTLVRLWKNGKLTLDSDASQSADVVVNGGTQPVARKTDKTIADTTMATWITKVTLVAAAIDNTIVKPTDFGVINGGATHFKG
jgi:phage gp45-like